MCGIFGAIGNSDPELVQFLAVLNESRGTDSFGMYDGRNIFRSDKKARECLTIKAFSGEKPFLMGHTRRASYGKVTTENAHPFHIGPIVGAHNGSVVNFEELVKEYDKEIKGDHKEEFQVDSQILFWGIWKKGFKFFEEVNSNWGLSWYDFRFPQYFFIGCHAQVLGVAQTDDCIYYSSDKEDLIKSGLTPYEVKNDTILKIDITTLEVEPIHIRARAHVKAVTPVATTQTWQRNTYGRSTYTPPADNNTGVPIFKKYEHKHPLEIPQTPIIADVGEPMSLATPLLLLPTRHTSESEI